ncbi:dihydrodipicolinate synthase family protein [uncultured Maribacter sp.]|uniref:dihydrodipicolinate synthase family protein n=1 Tax=uncultured Maribacter sp. TaxID=431308 RepID=UPI002616A8EE|nr:dihydrodipicolinate synthase family protein [uncultured Maribacter sp.]
MEKKAELTGILPVIPTPFNEDMSIDKASIKKVTSFCIESGASALVFPGVASEYDFLSSAERLELLEAIYEVNQGKLPIICGGGKGSAEEIGENILKSEKFGVHAVMVLIPKQFKEDIEGATNFMKTVSEIAPNVDVILQNAPFPIGAGLDPESICEIAKAVKQIKYVKEETLPSGNKITNLIKNAPSHLIGVIGGGGARYVIDEMNRGTVAAMPAAEITDLHVAMWNAHKSGDIALARTIYKDTLPLLIIQAVYRMRLTKYVLTLRGVFKNSVVKAPLPELDAQDKEELKYQLESLSKYLKTTTTV